MIDFSKFINLSYLTDATPDSDFQFLLTFAIFFGLLLLAGIVLAILAWKQKKTWQGPIGNWFRWFGIAGLFLTFARQQGLPFLSMRLLYYFLALGFFGWLTLIVRQLQRDQQLQAEKAKRYETFDKYLPRSRSRAN